MSNNSELLTVAIEAALEAGAGRGLRRGPRWRRPYDEYARYRYCLGRRGAEPRQFRAGKENWAAEAE